MELLSVLSKFFNTTWHDSQLLFSYQSFSKTFLSRRCPKFSQTCEWDFSWPDSSATHFALPITIKHSQVPISSYNWEFGYFILGLRRGRINPLVTHTSHAFVHKVGGVYVFFPKKKRSLEIWEVCFLGVLFKIFAIFFLTSCEFTQQIFGSFANIFFM